jgi:hypothetical protein
LRVNSAVILTSILNLTLLQGVLYKTILLGGKMKLGRDRRIIFLYADFLNIHAVSYKIILCS